MNPSLPKLPYNGTNHRQNHQPDYQDAALFIERGYRRVFNARIKTNFPQLMCVSDDRNSLLAVAGIRDSKTPFYSEHYLEDSAENTLSRFYQQTIERKHIVEIGNLTGSGDAGATYFLLHALWSHLVSSQYKFLLITCTRNLRRRFTQLPVHTLTKATPFQVPQHDKWGSYYHTDPVVLTGQLFDYDFRFAKNTGNKSYWVSLVSREENQ